MHSRVWLWYQSFSPFYPIAWQTNRRSPLGIQFKHTLRISSAFTAIKCSEHRQHVTAKRESSTSLYYFSESSENFPKQILFFSRHTIKNTQRHKFRAASSCCMSDIHFFSRRRSRLGREGKKLFSESRNFHRIFMFSWSRKIKRQTLICARLHSYQNRFVFMREGFLWRRFSSASRLQQRVDL